jgi:tetratricopeptide (TPR) repeat protein
MIYKFLLVILALALLMAGAGSAVLADEINTWENQVGFLMKTGKFSEALDAVDMALETEPYDYALDDKGYILYELGRYNESVAIFEEALSLTPDDPDAWYGKGIALLELDLYKEAMASFSQAINLDSEFSDAWVGMGECLIGMENDQAALEPLKQAITIDPDYSYAWYLQGVALINLDRKEEAVFPLRRALEIDPEYEEASVLLDMAGGNSSFIGSFYDKMMEES